MTRIDFYILEDVNLAAQYRFACRLATKALSGSSERVVVHASDERTARHLDELLWDYPDRRFVPHALQGTGAAQDTEVLITWQEPPHFDGVLVNLAHEVPEFFNRFHRVAEVVVGETRDQGRERYRFYRHRGYPLYDHKLKDWEAAAG
jgi:DNA polymerase-3 subunit chi